MATFRSPELGVDHIRGLVSVVVALAGPYVAKTGKFHPESP
jgi:hypothetical protein